MLYADEAGQRGILRMAGLFGAGGGLALTYLNLVFAREMNAGADPDMGPIYFNIALNCAFAAAPVEWPALPQAASEVT